MNSPARFVGPYVIMTTYGACSSVVELRTEAPAVVGSNPTTHPKFSISYKPIQSLLSQLAATISTTRPCSRRISSGIAVPYVLNVVRMSA